MGQDSKPKKKRTGRRAVADPLAKLTPEEQEYIKTLPPEQRIVRPDIIEHAEASIRKHSKLLKLLAKWDHKSAEEDNK